MQSIIQKSSMFLWQVPSWVHALVWLGIVMVLSELSPFLFDAFHRNENPELLVGFSSVAVIFLLSFITYHLSRGTPLPPFVVAIFFGMAAKPFLMPIIENKIALEMLVSIGATLILFQGGLETAFGSFKKLFWKIFMLAFPGVLVSAFLLSVTLAFMGEITGVALTASAMVILGAVLASTDPAAIIPLLQKLKFKKEETKDLLVSESAMNDVVGALLTLVLVAVLKEGGAFSSITEGFGNLFSMHAGVVLLEQTLYGVLFGLAGVFLLRFFGHFKARHDHESGADAAYFMFVPIMAFCGSLMVGGSGYLAAFIAGLVFQMVEHIKGSEHFFNNTIDGFAKPSIFLLLGAMVDMESLFAYTGIGIAVALLFMFVVRPLMVFITLLPFRYFGKDRFEISELLFLSFVRETGVIPAVLLVTIANMALPGMDGVMAIGMWVILLTLIIQPPLTPWVARRLGIAR